MLPYQLIALDGVVGALVHAVCYESRHRDEVTLLRRLLCAWLEFSLTGMIRMM